VTRAGALAAALVALLFARGAPAEPDPRRLAVASLHPVALLLGELAGERWRIQTLVPPGASPHAFEPRARDVASIGEARIFVRVGAGIDDWTLALLAAAPDPPAVLALMQSPGLSPLASAHRHAGEPAAPDPHVWLDPIRVRDALAPALAAELARLDPDGAAFYAARRADFARRLTALDAELAALLAPAPGRGFVAFHPAWRYFAARYGLEEIGVLEDNAGEEPTPRALARLVDASRRAGVGAILVEPQLPTRVAATVAAEFGGVTVQVDPLGDPSDPARADYAALLRWNARAFARALGAP
jgi:ABC-type Zn uptake system ZnuABC Zn-binding protein ZnuA